MGFQVGSRMGLPAHEVRRSWRRYLLRDVRVMPIFLAMAIKRISGGRWSFVPGHPDEKTRSDERHTGCDSLITGRCSDRDRCTTIAIAMSMTPPIDPSSANLIGNIGLNNSQCSVSHARWIGAAPRRLRDDRLSVHPARLAAEMHWNATLAPGVVIVHGNGLVIVARRSSRPVASCRRM